MKQKTHLSKRELAQLQAMRANERALIIGMAQAEAKRLADIKTIGLKEKLASNSDLQRRKRLTQQERTLEAIEIVAKNKKERMELFTGQDHSYEQAKLETIKLAEIINAK
jgi:hypothetical protein